MGNRGGSSQEPSELLAEFVLNDSTMWKGFRVVPAIALAAVSCSHGVSRIQTGVLSGPNPTTYAFPLPLETVHTNALEAFSRQHQSQQPIFARARSAVSCEYVLTAECSTNAVSGKEVLSDPANAHDLYLHSFHTPFVLSSVYRGREGGLPFIAAFHLHLAGSGSNTVVTVTASDAEVINGTKFGLGSCGPGQHWNCVRVAPTTVEEYTILRYLGSHLGVTNMPAVVVPAS
jgi:hypothetical protein